MSVASAADMPALMQLWDVVLNELSMVAKIPGRRIVAVVNRRFSEFVRRSHTEGLLSEATPVLMVHCVECSHSFQRPVQEQDSQIRDRVACPRCGVGISLVADPGN